jgi:2-hydroxy-6-oxonona-2,4-dienedioate hydrolase
MESEWIILLVASACFIAATLVIGFAFRRDMRGADDALSHGALIAQTLVGAIEYTERGTGPPLLSIHGAGGGYDQGLALAAEVAGERFRVIAPSRFGYLGTPVPPDTSVQAQADAHAALLDMLRVESVIVMGTSAGALSAIEFAIRHPGRVRALILIAPASYSPNSPAAIEKSRGSRLAFWLVNAGANFVWWALEKTTPTRLIRFLGVPPQVFANASHADQQRVLRWVRSVQPLSVRFQGINIDSNPPGLRPAFERIGVPTLVAVARDDLFNTAPAAEYAVAQIAQSSLVVFESGGHLLVGHQETVRTRVRDFLESVASANQDETVRTKTVMSGGDRVASEPVNRPENLHLKWSDEWNELGRTESEGTDLAGVTIDRDI